MNVLKSTLLAMLLISMLGLFTACSGGAEAGSEAAPTTEAPATDDAATSNAEGEAPAAKAPVSNGDQGALLYGNTTVAFMGVLVVGMSKAFGGMAEGIAEAFGGNKDASEIDSKLSEVKGEAIDQTMNMKTAIADALASIKVEDAEVYERMFSTPTIVKGLAIAANAKLPDSFVPFHGPMTEADMKRWVVFLAQGDVDESHPAYVHFQEIMTWYQEINAEFQEDPEITTVTDKLREKTQ